MRTLRMDRHFKGIGRLQKNTGVTSKKHYNQLSAMLTDLYQTAKHDVIREIINGSVTILEAFDHWTNGRLTHLPSAATLLPVIPTITDWIAKHDVAETTRRNYTSEVSRFIKNQGEMTIAQLPIGLKDYKAYCDESGKARTFNYLRTALLSYLHDVFGQDHQLWIAVRNLGTITSTTVDQAPQLTVIEAQDLIASLKPVHAEIAKSMLFTGMHWKEVVGKWEVQPDRVVIHGEKTKDRKRFVPLIDPTIQHPKRANKAFRTAIRNWRDDISPYSFRRSFAHWMELAKIPRSRRKMYLGHSMGTVQDLYERHDVERFLKEDADTLRAFIFDQWRNRNVPKVQKQPSPIRIFKK